MKTLEHIAVLPANHARAVNLNIWAYSGFSLPAAYLHNFVARIDLPRHTSRGFQVDQRHKVNSCASASDFESLNVEVIRGNPAAYLTQWQFVVFLNTTRSKKAVYRTSGSLDLTTSWQALRICFPF